MDGKRKKERRKGGRKEENGARAKVCLISVNLLSFHLLFSRKKVDMDLANIYYFLNTIINSFLY